MKRCTRAAVIGAVAVAFAAATSVPAVAATARHRPLLGINVKAPYGGESAALIRDELAEVKHLNADVVRVELSWAHFEPAAAGKLNKPTVVATDEFVKDAERDHLKVIAMLDRTPCWATSAPEPILSQCGQGSEEAYAWPPREASSFGAFAGWLAHRYSHDLAAVEVWNEPDQENEHYLAGPEKPRHDAELLKAAYPEVKTANRNIAVLAGALVGSNGAFMEQLYQQKIQGFYNGVAVHFYSLVLASLRSFREVQLKFGDHTPLWLDEFGWSSCWPKEKIEQEQGCVTGQVQAENLQTSVRELARAPYLKAIASYKLQNTSHEEFGVLNAKGRRKPAFAGLAKAFASPFAAIGGISLKLRDDVGQVRVHLHAPVGDYLRLEASSPRGKFWATFTLNRFNQYSVTLPAGLGTAHVKVRVWQYWLGPQAAVERQI